MVMTKKSLIFLIALMLSSCYVEKQETATSGRLTVQASDGYQDLTQREANRFQELYPQAKFTVIPASTRETIVNMLNDSINLIVVDRAMNNEERQVYKQAQLAVQEVKIALDALVILVNADNSINNISLENLKRVLQGQISNWNIVRRIQSIE